MTLALAGCETSYKEAGRFASTGGYYESKLPNGDYIVGFAGNGFTNATKSADFALLRCAELTQQHGKNYFEVNQSAVLLMPDEMYSSIREPQVQYVVRFYNAPPANSKGQVYNALETTNRIRKQYGIR